LVLDDSWRFDRFRGAIRDLPADVDRPTLLSENFRIYADRGLSIYYAPFDRVNTRARLALVGVTPGWTQMEIAYRTARQELLEGHAREAILASVKRAASFAGSMRTNLVTMLDDLGLPEVLGAQRVRCSMSGAICFIRPQRSVTPFSSTEGITPAISPVR
jgi:hypothetical protein